MLGVGRIARLPRILIVLNHTPCSTTSRYSTGSHYDTLGLKSDASNPEIKEAFVNLSKKLHPDINPGNPNLHKRFVRVNEAYSVLSKPLRRKEYDEILGYSTRDTSNAEEWHPYNNEPYRKHYDEAMRDRMYADRMFHDHYSDSRQKRFYTSNFIFGSVLGSLAFMIFMFTLTDKFRERWHQRIEAGCEQNRIMLENTYPYKQKPPDK